MNVRTCQSCGNQCEGDVCTNCGALFEDTAVATAGASTHTLSFRTGIAHQSSAAIAAKPSSLSKVIASKTVRSRADMSGHTASSSSKLSRSLVEIKPSPSVAPLQIIKPDLSIPEHQRVCSNPSCTDEHGNPNSVVRYNKEGKVIPLDKGFCGKCRTPFSFEPIPPDTLVSSQYQVKGPLAVGGCGFLYLAWDVNVGRYVVLKGLINSKDQAAMAAAVQEKRFLADLVDPAIVQIINFVTHEGQTFIVMEFIDGVTLKTIRQRRNEPLQITEAITYILGILPAYTFLHSRQLQKVLYCDGKLDNFMVQGTRMRLIDLGGARMEGDNDSDYYFTIGYCAPEAGPDNPQPMPSVTSDLYTVARSLAVMLIDFDFSKTYRYSLPTPQDEPLFARYESLYRFLLRGTAENPDDRFQSAAEMQEQLLGVLREIVAVNEGQGRPLESTLFGADVHASTEAIGYRSLPILKVDQDDPAKGMIESALALNDQAMQLQLFAQAVAQYPPSTDAPLRVANSLIDMGQYDRAKEKLDALTEKDPFDWRNAWLHGRLALAQKNIEDAANYFDAVYSEIPGELTPKVALALCLEMQGDLDNAIRLYDLVSTVDPNFTTAAFGLARCLSACSDRDGAVIAYGRVPAVSIAHTDAVMESVRALIHTKPEAPGKDELVKAAEIFQSIVVDNYAGFRLKADLFLAAIEQGAAGVLKQDASVSLLGIALDEHALRVATEQVLRQCAHFTENPELKIKLVDEANRVRPVTTF